MFMLHSPLFDTDFLSLFYVKIDLQKFISILFFKKFNEIEILVAIFAI